MNHNETPSEVEQELHLCACEEPRGYWHDFAGKFVVRSSAEDTVVELGLEEEVASRSSYLIVFLVRGLNGVARSAALASRQLSL